MSLLLNNVSYEIYLNSILSAISFEVEKGQFVSLAGQNGAGKTTLLRCISSVIKNYKGSIKIEGRDIRSLASRERAKMIAYLPQQIETLYPYTVSEFLLMSRYAHQSLWFGVSNNDKDIAAHFIDRLCLGDRQESRLNEISGGELQRVLIAGALVQGARYLLLDEPTASLDPLQEEIFFNTIRDIRLTEGITVIMSTHNVSRVLSESDRVIAIREGRVLFDGDPQKLNDRSFLAALYSTKGNEKTFSL